MQQQFGGPSPSHMTLSLSLFVSLNQINWKMLNKGCVTYTCFLSDICAATSLLACVVSFIYREVAPLYATVAPPGDTGYATWRHRVRHGGATCRHLKNLAGRPYNSQHITEYTYHTRMVCLEDKLYKWFFSAVLNSLFYSY